jgi:D-galactarolactone cycloisomerase
MRKSSVLSRCAICIAQRQLPSLWGVGVKITEVRTYVLRQQGPQVYLQSRGGDALGDAGGGAPATEPDYIVRPPRSTVYARRFEALLVRIRADNGLTGWGEALTPVVPEAAQAIIDRLFAPLLRGEDPRPVGALRDRLAALMRVRGHLTGHQADALAAVDIALWDLAGKARDARVADLLGGARRERVPVYVSGLTAPTDAERADEARRWAGKGIRAIKLHLGLGIPSDLATFDAVTAAVPGVRVALDAHWAYQPPDALRLGRALDERGAWFLEAPTAPEDVDAHADLTRALAIPVAVGEALRNRYEAMQWLRARALSLCQPDIGRTGISEGMTIASLCSAANVPVAPHHSTGIGVALAAGLHVSAAVEELAAFEYQPVSVEVANRTLREPFTVSDGAMRLPDRPGLGIELDEDELERLSRQA